MPGAADRLRLRLLADTLAVARLDPTGPWPGWALAAEGSLVVLAQTRAERSVVARDADVPPDLCAERGWRALEVAGPLDFGLVGILAGLTAPLAAAGVPVFAVSTYDTDYLLVREGDLAQGVHALTEAGHLVEGTPPP